MSLTIPDNVNYLNFFLKAKERKISIRSKYRGVVLSYFRNDKSKPCWMARYQKTGQKSIYLGRFEFSNIGEKQARHAYSKYLFENNIKERTSIKRKYKKNENVNRSNEIQDSSYDYNRV